MTKNWDNLQCDELFFAANKLTREDRTTEAIKTLHEILSIDPCYGKAFNHLGWIYETKYQDYTKAEEFYQLGLKYGAEYPPVYHNYAVLLSTLRRFDELEAHLDLSSKVPGINMAKVWNEYAIMYELQGRFDEAIDAYQKNILELLDKNKVELASDSIARCERKKEILHQGGHLSLS